MRIALLTLFVALALGCSSDPEPATTSPPSADAAAADIIASAEGGATDATAETAAKPGTGGAPSPGGSGGAGGSVLPDAGPVSTGGAGGSPVGSGGADGGAGGAPAYPVCVDPNGWRLDGTNCDKIGPRGTEPKHKGALICTIACHSVQPGGLPGNNIGAPFHPECAFSATGGPPDSVCVASCAECQ